MGLIIYAPNIHQGGGRSLLLPLLEACAGLPCRLVLDERLQLTASVSAHSGTIHRVHPGPFARLKAEWLLRNLAKPGDVALCMANLPPLLPLAAKAIVFMQNRSLVDGRITLAEFPWKVRARIRLERLWLKSRKANAHTFIVQTSSMREALESALGSEPVIMPFLAHRNSVSRRANLVHAERTHDFLYVASGDPHKNHRTLVEAWVLLAREGLHPRLCLTVDREAYPALSDWIEQKTNAFGLQVTNAGALSQESVLGLYHDAKALIFPSQLESFGLPLIEARQAGLPILAGELDYVRDLIDPEESFDPHSARSIARAVKRFLGVAQADAEVMDAATFLNAVIQGSDEVCTS